MVKDICTVQYVVLDRDIELFDPLEYKNCVYNYLSNSMAEFIVKEADITEEDWYSTGTLFQLKLAILTPERYQELLRAEKQLKKLKEDFSAY